MHKNLSEIAAHKKRLRSEVVVPKKIVLSLSVTVFSRREQLLSEYSVSLFHERSCGHPPSIPQWIWYFLEEHLQP